MSFAVWKTILIVLAVLVAFGIYLSWKAGRLDRLHARVDGARAALDAQLVRRASVTLELATSGLLDPATSLLLAGAAHEAREAEPDERELAESDLTKALRAAFDQPEQVATVRLDPSGTELVGELDAAMRRVQLARRFHNEAVRATDALRAQRIVRWFRLAGRAPMPATFEIDDTAPVPLARDGAL